VARVPASKILSADDDRKTVSTTTNLPGTATAPRTRPNHSYNIPVTAKTPPSTVSTVSGISAPMADTKSPFQCLPRSADALQIKHALAPRIASN
jgi:hypothetical protein